MRLPKSQLTENQYTSGGEFINTSTNRVYSGPYWIGNGRYFTGKIFDLNSIELKRITPQEIQKVDITNNLPNNLPKSVSSNITNTVLNNSSTSVTSIPVNSNTGKFRYFSRQTNVTPSLVKEISQSTFDNIKSNALYQTLAISSNAIYKDSIVLNEADKSFQGIKGFLGF